MDYLMIQYESLTNGNRVLKVSAKENT